MQTFKPLAAALLLGLSTLPSSAGSLWSTDGFDMPESVAFDAAGDRLIVSVMEGAPNAVDGNGHLALLSTDGKIIDVHRKIQVNGLSEDHELKRTELECDLAEMECTDVTPMKHISDTKLLYRSTLQAKG